MMTGKLDIIMGCMFSGKTSELMKRIEKAKLIYNDDVLVINHLSDKRYGDDNGIYSHNKLFHSSLQCNNLYALICNDDFKKSKAVFIDEAQFFDDLYQFVVYCVEGLNKWVTVCGLDGDFKRRKFGQIIDLIPFADSVTKKKALCLRCKNGTEAMFSKRIDSDTDDQVVVGNENKYESVCRYHYLVN